MNTGIRYSGRQPDLLFLRGTGVGRIAAFVVSQRLRLEPADRKAPGNPKKSEGVFDRLHRGEPWAPGLLQVRRLPDRHRQLALGDLHPPDRRGPAHRNQLFYLTDHVVYHRRLSGNQITPNVLY